MPSKGTPFSSFLFLISIPSGLFEPTSCNAMICATTKPIITIGTDIKSSGDALDLSQKFAVVFASVGIHPNDCINTSDADLGEIEKMAQTDKAIAIGEIGLDYYRQYTPKAKQQDVLRKQVRLARKLGLPIIIHNRDAHEDIYKVLKDEKEKRIFSEKNCLSFPLLIY